MTSSGGGSGVAAALFAVTLGGMLVFSALKGITIPELVSGVKGDPLNAKGGGKDLAVPSPGTSPTSTDFPAYSTGIEKPGSWTVPNGGASSFKGPKAALLDNLAGIAQNQFRLRITATTNGNHVANSKHFLGRAFDASGAPADMQAFCAYVVANYLGSITQLIHNPGYAVLNGMKVSPLVYAAVWEGHKDHAHLAM